MTKLTKLKNSEYHYLIDCEVERELHPHHDDNSIVVFEYTSNVVKIINELVTNKIQFSHYISPDVELSYLIIDIEMQYSTTQCKITTKQNIYFTQHKNDVSKIL